MEYNSFTGTISGAATGTEVSVHSGQLVTKANASSEFNAATDFEVTGDIMSTVRNATGSPVTGRELRPSDTIQVHGQRMTLAMAQHLEFVTTDAWGKFSATDSGTAGATKGDPEGGKIALQSGGTAEEAAASDFRGTPAAEEALTSIASAVSTDTQIAALDSFLRNGGEVETRIIERMASQASLEPHQMQDLIATAHSGMEQAVMNRLAPMGVYDQDAFASFIQGSADTQGQMINSVRDLMMYNSTKGLEELATKFVEQADVVDPANVELALEEAGIPFKRGQSGVVLDLTKQGLGQMSFRQAVRQGIIKLSRNR